MMSRKNCFIIGVVLFGGVTTVNANSVQVGPTGVGHTVAQDILTFSPQALPLTSKVQSGADSSFSLLFPDRLYPSLRANSSISGLAKTETLFTAIPPTKSLTIKFNDYRHWSPSPVTQSERDSWVDRLILSFWG